ncbi:hypothetical protein [Algoriphagus aquimarinus]|uniref:6-bladed beta-propeller n=1 Tax=Algoriphagus aquimarinus TaxID=237018 RepID=A0A5C7AE51_9BACT|nr:hypothetical protein [Algoriphagus aquimarinus]TXE06691.1 hypothetical protein ESV85_16490 [Algoriphagus aquimarinus]
MKKINALFTCSILLAFACSSPKNNEENQSINSNEWELQIVDSIQVDYLGQLMLLAIHPDGNHFLFGNSANNHLILTDGKGDIITTYEEPADAPTSVGPLTTSATFLGDQIIAMGNNRLAVYDLKLQFLKSLKFPPIGRGMYYNGFDFLQPISLQGENELLGFIGGPQNDIPSNQPEYYSQYNLFELFNLDQETFSPVVPFHEKSRFLNGEAFDFLAPKFQVDGSKVSFVYSNDSLLYSYDLSVEQDSFKAQSIPFDKFLLNPGYPMKGSPDYETKTDREGGIWSFFKIGDNHLITYTSGIELENMPDLTQEMEILIQELERLNPMKWLVLDENGKSSRPQLVSDKYRLNRQDNHGFIWADQNVNSLEEEPEYAVFYKLKLVQK